MVSYKGLNTIGKTISPQTRDGIRNGDGGQATTIREAIIRQIRDGTRNDDGGQTTTIEATSTQTLYRIRDSDGG